MKYQARSIRTFIGAKDYEESRAFYRALDFKEVVIDSTMSLFLIDDRLGFYLQDYYVRDWVNNSMVFLEMEDVEDCTRGLLEKKLSERFPAVRFTGIKDFEWGRELFMHDPSGVLWHFCQFTEKPSHPS